MNWNFGNIVICVSCVVLIFYALRRLFFVKNTTTYKYLCWLIISSALTILQVILIDAKVTDVYPGVYLFYIPWEFIAPVCFSAFISSYLDRMPEFNKYRNLLLIPFVIFTVIYTVQKLNAFLGYPWYAESIMLKINNEWNENLAVLFAFGNGLWNYKMIKRYEYSLLGVPYKEVLQKTQWLRRMYTILICLSILWVLVIIYLKVTVFTRSMKAYYPLWLLYLGYYFTFIYIAQNHLRNKAVQEEKARLKLDGIVKDFHLEGLNLVFASEELDGLLGNTKEVTQVLSYFATSLFDKKNENDVLWDIVKNAISKLDLEDCVIYMIDKERQVLVQKAAYGNKARETKKVLSPIEIPLGQGIVGTVAMSGKWECIADVKQDPRYILDDLKRQSELAVPIVHDDEILGVLDSEHSKKNFFDNRDVFIFQLIAKLTAAKIKQIDKKGSLTITNDNGYYKKLCYLVENEKIYRDPELSLAAIAERLNISVSYLSQLINTLSGVNFSDYINRYRVKECKRLLLHPNYRSYSILSVGLEAGFNSKSAFYTAFKKYTGTTPSDYRVKTPFTS